MASVYEHIQCTEYSRCLGRLWVIALQYQAFPRKSFLFKRNCFFSVSIVSSSISLYAHRIIPPNVDKEDKEDREHDSHFIFSNLGFFSAYKFFLLLFSPFFFLVASSQYLQAG